MSTQPDPLSDLGRATVYRTFESLHQIGLDPAPAGYEWVDLPGGYGALGDCTRVLACLRCGVGVVLHEAHTQWHQP